MFQDKYTEKGFVQKLSGEQEPDETEQTEATETGPVQQGNESGAVTETNDQNSETGSVQQTEQPNLAQLITQLADSWVRKQDSMQQTLVNTKQVLKQVPPNQISDVIQTLSSVLINCKDSNNNRIFTDQNSAIDFLKSVYMSESKLDNPFDIANTVSDNNDSLTRELQTETIYGYELSPMMKRRIISNITRKHIYPN